MAEQVSVPGKPPGAGVNEHLPQQAKGGQFWMARLWLSTGRISHSRALGPLYTNQIHNVYIYLILVIIVITEADFCG